MSDIGGKTAALAQSNQQLQNASLQPTPEITSLWKKVHNEMRQEFGEAIFRSWLKPMTLQAYYHGTMEISVPTRFMRDWIQTHYAERIQAMCNTANEDIRRVQFVVIQNAIADAGLDPAQEKAVIEKVKANQNRKEEIAQIAADRPSRSTS